MSNRNIPPVRNEIKRKKKPGFNIKSICRNFLRNNKEVLQKEDHKALRVGRFRLGGEIHQWMYDSCSLGRLLKDVGFKQVVSRDAVTSYFENWRKFNLDTDPDGSIYKPDSGYIEGIK